MQLGGCGIIRPVYILLLNIVRSRPDALRKEKPVTQCWELDITQIQVPSAILQPSSGYNPSSKVLSGEICSTVEPAQ